MIQSCPLRRARRPRLPWPTRETDCAPVAFRGWHPTGPPDRPPRGRGGRMLYWRRTTSRCIRRVMPPPEPPGRANPGPSAGRPGRRPGSGRRGVAPPPADRPGRAGAGRAHRAREPLAAGRHPVDAARPGRGGRGRPRGVRLRVGPDREPGGRARRADALAAAHRPQSGHRPAAPPAPMAAQARAGRGLRCSCRPTGCGPTEVDEAARPGWHVHDSVHAALERLPAEQREAVRLAYFQGLTHSEIATRARDPDGHGEDPASARVRQAAGRPGADQGLDRMNAHDWYVENRAAFVARSLEPGEERTFRDHLVRCEECTPGGRRAWSATSPGCRWASRPSPRPRPGPPDRGRDPRPPRPLAQAPAARHRGRARAGRRRRGPPRAQRRPRAAGTPLGRERPGWRRWRTRSPCCAGPTRCSRPGSRWTATRAAC